MPPVLLCVSAVLPVFLSDQADGRRAYADGRVRIAGGRAHAGRRMRAPLGVVGSP